jgi:hypothetical protein
MVNVDFVVVDVVVAEEDDEIWWNCCAGCPSDRNDDRVGME